MSPAVKTEVEVEVAEDLSSAWVPLYITAGITLNYSTVVFRDGHQIRDMALLPNGQ